MSATLKLDDVRKAWDARDPDLPAILSSLVTQSDPEPETPIRPEAPTFEKFIRSLTAWDYRRKDKPAQAAFRVEQLKLLEAPDAEVPLPERLKTHLFLMELWAQPENIAARQTLLTLLATIPLQYGPWRAMKRIFKEAEATRDMEVYCLLAARFDTAFARGETHGVSGATLAYLARRAWRYLRRLAVHLPAAYADTAAELMGHYIETTGYQAYHNSTWILNHILFHGSKQYGRSRWKGGKRDPATLKNRAYPELWKRTARPLFSLLERAKCDFVRSFATSALKADYRAELRDVEPEWVIRLVGRQSAALDDFVVWILQNVPKFEQGRFRELGLHEPVLRLFDSGSAVAQKYAAEYARTHARDLSVDRLIGLANSSSEIVRKLAKDLLDERDPRTQVGLEAWGRLLETPNGFEYASAAIKKHFGPSELTPDWFRDRLLATANYKSMGFLTDLLAKTHAIPTLSSSFFRDLLRGLDGKSYWVSNQIANQVIGWLNKTDLNALDAEFLKWMYLFPQTSNAVDRWIVGNKIKPTKLGVGFFKSIAFQPDWDKDPWFEEFRRSNGKWAADLKFNDNLSAMVLTWIADPRRFSPTDLGLDWLLSVANRAEPRYHDFASEAISRLFIPADFAPRAAGESSMSVAATVDLKKDTFLFTGKMKTMKREDAETQVKAANGTVAGSVTPKLMYLVIGDDGSPLYGQGAKGSKQTKGEELNAKGANIRIISETQFLQMLAGVTRKADGGNDAIAGSQRLWDMLLAPGPADAPSSSFARFYFKRHHPEIAQRETDKPVDAGAEIPKEFLTLERFMPLFAESRRPIRDFALDIAKYEFSRWKPTGDDLVRLAEMPYAEVKRFVENALLADDDGKKIAFRIDPATLSSAVVYRFCESGDPDTRNLGMGIIRRVPKFAAPEELFRLSESPDRVVRSFVIRSLWTVYRDRGLTQGWLPTVQSKSTVGIKAKKAAKRAEEAARVTVGVPVRPTTLPVGQPTLAGFLRRILFEIPPGRPEFKVVEEGQEAGVRVRPTPTRQSKLEAVAVMRDMGLEDPTFGHLILPLLEEFMVSRGQSEKAACLVAVTRIRHSLSAV